MKNIVIIGDSFGVPNWYGPPGTPPEHHIEFFLKDIKHNGARKYEVTNLSINGSNGKTHISQLKKFIALHPLTRIDHIVWFQNSSLNFCLHLIRTPLNMHRTLDTLRESLIEIYKETVQVKKQLTAKWIAIGGSTPIPEFFNDYNIHDYIIQDWRARILKERLPPAYALHTGDIFAHGHGVTNIYKIINNEFNMESPDLKQIITKNLESIQKLIVSNKELFPDAIHPGLAPHLALSKELDTYFTFGTGPGAVAR